MIVHLSPQAPWWIRDAASAALALHIGGAGLGLVAGAVAVAVRKGARLHRVAGDAFVVGMLTMASIGAIMAPLIHQPFDAVMGVFTFYLVASGWAAMQHAPRAVARMEAGGILIALGVAGLGLWMAWTVGYVPDGAIERTVACVVAGLAALAAGLDLRVILSGGVSRAQRLARHLWRMCVGFFIATASFFLGQQQVLPHFIRGSPLLIIPAFAPLGLMIFWLLRVRSAGRPRPDRSAALALGARAR